MAGLKKHDLCVWPRYLCSGRKPAEQVIVGYIWAMAIEGKEWTLADISRECGTGVTRKHLDALAEEGVLLRSEKEEAKPCHEYIANADFVPDHEAPQSKSRKSSTPMPPWVFKAVGIWKRQGVVGPRQMYAALKAVVQLNGEEKTLAGLSRYARETEARFNPSPLKFAATAARWMDGGTTSGETRGRLFSEV